MSEEINTMPILYWYTTEEHLRRQLPNIPISMLSEEMAQRNHSQTLARLKERGGMSPKEILANINGHSLFSFREGFTEGQAVERILVKIKEVSHV